MKTTFLLMLLLSLVFGTSGQDITISFQSKVAGTQIDSIWVTNLKTDQKVRLLGNDFLTLSKTTGINVSSSFTENGYLYPNPCYGDASVSFSTSFNQNVELKVYNISGQVLSTKRQYLAPGRHTFVIKFPTTGIYAISVLKNDKPLIFKAVCTGVEIQECRIDYSNSEASKQLKSAKVGKTLNYAPGDILLYSTFSGKNNTIITDSPTTTKVYDVEFFECIDGDKNSYPIVKIGNQWWMAKNLAYLPAVSPPTTASATVPYYYIYGYSGTDVAAAKATANYSTYGVLYNWLAAKAACPSGWHLPGDAEWTTLSTFLGGESVAQGKMEETGTAHWQIPNTDATNESGFSSLPGGGCFNFEGFYKFYSIGYYGRWWSSMEASITDAWYRFLASQTTDFRNSYPKESGFSVRCVKGDNSTLNISTKPVIAITNSSATGGGESIYDGGLAITARGVCWSTIPNPDISGNKTTDGTGTEPFTSTLTPLTDSTLYYVRAYATNSKGTAYGNQVTFTTLKNNPTVSFTDNRDGKTYKTIKIGNQCWMAENLAYLPVVSPPTIGSNTAAYYYVYGYDGTDVSAAKNNANYSTYGVLYNWSAAMTACPSGWHLPSDAEWKQLEMALGMTQTQADATGWRGTDQGKKMKTTSGWSYNGNGTNSSGFSGLPGGYRGSNGGFFYIGSYGYWWSSTATTTAWVRILDYYDSGVFRANDSKGIGWSVRCVRD